MRQEAAGRGALALAAAGGAAPGCGSGAGQAGSRAEWRGLERRRVAQAGPGAERRRLGWCGSSRRAGGEAPAQAWWLDAGGWWALGERPRRGARGSWSAGAV
jgi:hypothetical protein